MPPMYVRHTLENKTLRELRWRNICARRGRTRRLLDKSERVPMQSQLPTDCPSPEWRFSHNKHHRQPNEKAPVEFLGSESDSEEEVALRSVAPREAPIGAEATTSVDDEKSLRRCKKKRKSHRRSSSSSSSSSSVSSELSASAAPLLTLSSLSESSDNDIERRKPSGSFSAIDLAENTYSAPPTAIGALPRSDWNAQQGPYVIVSKWGYPYGGGEDFLLDTMSYASSDLGMHAIWLCFTDGKNVPYDSFRIDRCGDLRGGEGQQQRRSEKEKSAHSDAPGDALSIIIRVNGGFTQRSLYCWLRLLRPAFVHQQGVLKSETEEICRLLRIPLLSGFHFWNGLVRLDEKTFNVRILDNIHRHAADSELHARCTAESDVVYVASEFMREVVSKVSIADDTDQCASRIRVIPPLSGGDKCLAHSGDSPAASFISLWDGDSGSQKYVLLINVHESKGGRLLLHLLREMPDVPFLGVRTDTYRTPFDDELDAAFSKHRLSRLIGRVEDVRLLYSRALVVLQASEVDETFCRVFVEACASGVPTLCSDYGNLPNLLATREARQECLVCSADCSRAEAYERWRDRLAKLLAEPRLLRRLAKIVLENYAALQGILRPREAFAECCDEIMRRQANRPRNIALLTPWCDQGLGIQNRNYAYMLRKQGYRVFVLAFMPYTRTAHRADPSEWEIEDVVVHESPNVREHITLQEIVYFVTKYQIDAAILAETCWDRVFTMNLELRALGVRTYAVPNIEILREDEIEKHRLFHRILLNNRICGDVLRSHGIEQERLCYVGYNIEQKPSRDNVGEDTACLKHRATQDSVNPISFLLEPNSSETSTGRRRQVKFLILGGMNAVFRKHVDVVVEAFIDAQFCLLGADPKVQEKRISLSLVATSQKADEKLQRIATRIETKGLFGAEEKTDSNNSATATRDQLKQVYGSVKLLIWHLTSKDVKDLYCWSDVIVQVSKHEGLGIGFFEAQALLKPVLTLDVPPHNEIVTEQSGWVVQADSLVENDENDSGCLKAAHVSRETIRDFFVRVGSMTDNEWRQQYEKKREYIAAQIPERRDFFRKAFCAALDDCSPVPNLTFA